MYCSQCGKKIADGSKFCSFCGKPQESEQALNSEHAINSEYAINNEHITNSDERTTVEENTTQNETIYQASDEMAKQSSNSQSSGFKKKFLVMGIGLVAVIIGVVFFIVYQSKLQAQSWEEWVLDYKEEMAAYYLSDKQETSLNDFMVQSVEAEKKEAQETLKVEMIALKEQVVSENEKYQSDIETGLNQIASGYNLTFAFEDELSQIETMQSEIKSMKENKQYPEALARIKECQALQEKIQTVQSGWNVSIVQRDVSQYPKVKLYLDIRDEMGTPIENLNQKIFFLSQKDAQSGEYIKREITSALQLNQNESININLVADVSGSMDGDLYTVKGIMNNFLNTVQFGVGDQIALTEFSDTSYLAQNFTSDKSSIIEQVNWMDTYGGTKLYDTLIESVMRVYGQSGAKCVIAFTDGFDNRSVSSADDVVRVAQNTDIPIFIIGIGNDVDHNLLSYMASSTGGYYTNATNLSTMQEIYNSIYTAQKQVYCLEYQADDESMMTLQDVSIYLRGENAGGTVEYAYTPSDDFFDMLLNNFLNSYIEALTVGDPLVMERAGYASTSGGVYKETSQYIKKHKDKLSEQLLQAEVIDVQYIDKDTYEITSNEIYDIQWLRDYTNDIAEDTSDESTSARNLLFRYYPEEYLHGQAIKVYKSRTLKGHYRVKRSPEGRWQIADFTKSYEILGTNTYNAHIDGEE